MFHKGEHKRSFAYEAHTACNKNSYALETVVTPGNVHDSVAFDDGRVLSTAYKRPMTMKGGHPWWAYVYDEYYNCVICPEYQPLAYCTTNRDGYREYASDPKICAQCPTRHLCTKSKNCVKTVLQHIWKDYVELADDARYTPEYRGLYARRKEPLSGFSPTLRKNTLCATLFTVV